MHPNIVHASATLGRCVLARLFSIAALAFLVATVIPTPAHGGLIAVTVPASQNVEEGTAAFNQQWDILNTGPSSVDILWSNQNSPYLSTNKGGADATDIPVLKNASSAESVGRFWFRESSQVVIKGNFHSLVGTKAVGSSGNHSDFVVETLNGAIGDFSFGSKPIQDQRLMGA